MDRFVGKVSVGGRILDETIGGSIEADPSAALASTGRVALPRAAEQLVRTSIGPIRLITEGGPTFRVVLGRSQAVGDLYVAFDFDGRVDLHEELPVFSILAYPDLREARDPEAEPVMDADPTLLAFTPRRQDQPLARSDRG